MAQRRDLSFQVVQDLGFNRKQLASLKQFVLESHFRRLVLQTGRFEHLVDA
jgi:hypothetical protein